jgi:transposase
VLHLEGWMKLRELKQRGLSISEISRQMGLDRKTVRRHLDEPPGKYERPKRATKLDPFVAYLRERWEQGVGNGAKLYRELQKRDYRGGYTQLRYLLKDWRNEERERAYVRFETSPGEQSQLDWGSFGNWNGHRLYCFALTLSWSRMSYVEFTQRQDTETLLDCMVHAFRHLGGVTETILTDNMKTVVLERRQGQPVWNPRYLDFASYYGFLPRLCQPYRPETKGKIESTIRFVRGNFWPGIRFSSIADLNQQALEWSVEVGGRVHQTTREIPAERWSRENLKSLEGQADYDTGYAEVRQVAKDCLISYRGNRYSVPYELVGKTVVVRHPVAGERITIWHQQNKVAAHALGPGAGRMAIDPEHYRGLPRKQRPQSPPPAGLPMPEVETRPLSVYEEVAYGAAV